MKRIMALALCLVMISLVPCGCVGRSVDNGKLRIVATVFPGYDWVMEILGEKADSADVTLLLDNGSDLHSYNPSASDIIKITTCDLFIYVGGESDQWVDGALAKAWNKKPAVINLLDVLGEKAKEEEIKEGMQGDDDANEDGPEYDEHVWLSLRNAAEFCRVIAEKLGELDPDGKAVYDANALAYISKLNDLDGKYTEAVAAAKTKTLLFGDRFPFKYFVDDYGLDYYAAFAGCSAESEASFETVVFLAGKADELGISAIIQLESSDGRLAKTIKEASASKDLQILTLDSMQSVTAQKIKDGASYLSVMEKNLEVLKTALK